MSLLLFLWRLGVVFSLFEFDLVLFFFLGFWDFAVMDFYLTFFL